MISKLPIIIVLFLPNRSIMNPLRRLPSIWTGEPKLTEKRQYLVEYLEERNLNFKFTKTKKLRFCRKLFFKISISILGTSLCKPLLFQT